MQTPVTHIEGYEGFESIELENDTDPGARFTKFEVVSEEVCIDPITGRTAPKNFVVIHRKWDLGRSETFTRVNDQIAFDEISKKWKVLQLYKIVLPGNPPRPQSHIRRYTAEWNAFVNGTSNEIGTPLAFLFPHDPSRVEYYKHYHIISIEQLAKATASETDGLGLGAKGEKEKAQQYLARAEETRSAGLAELMEKKLHDKDAEMKALQAQLNDVTEKLSTVLQKNIKAAHAPKKPLGRPKKIIVETIEGTQP